MPTTWTERSSYAGYNEVDTFETIARNTAELTGTATWPNACNVVNWTAMLALKPAGPGAAFVQKAGSSSPFVGGTFNTWSQAFASPLSAGNAVIVCIAWNTAFALSGVTVTDTQGNIYKPLMGGHVPGSADFLAVFVTTSCSAGANTVTATQTGSVDFQAVSMAIHEYSGLDGTLPSGTPPANFGYSYTDPTGICDDVVYGGAAHVNVISQTVDPTEESDLILFVCATMPACAGVVVATPEPERCPVAWLVINEPGSVSPLTANVWTDQSERLYFGESITFSWIVKQRGTASIPLIVRAGDTYEPTIGSQVCLWDLTANGDNEVFSGTIDDYEERWLGNDGDRIYTLTCVSLEQVFDTIRLPNLLYEDKTAGFIFNDLFGYADGSPVSLGTVSSGPVIANFLVSDFPSIADMFSRLATLAQFIWGVDPGTGEAYFHAPTLEPSPFTLDSTDVLWLSFNRKKERHDYRNRQIIKLNSNVAVQSSELFAGAGQQSFTLLRPVSQVTFGWTTQNTENSATGTFTGQPAAGDTITISYPGSGSIYNWAAAAPYVVGQIVIDSAGYVQRCTVSGTSGGAEPAWVEVYGQVTVDNTAVWTNEGPAGFANGAVAVYTFVTSLDNTEFGQVLIGANLAATIQNLVDAFNSIQSQAGLTFSLPTWENPLLNADTPGGATTIVVRNKAAGAGYIAALADSCANFSWNRAITSGGITTFGTDPVTVGVAGQTTGGSGFTIVYTPGSNLVTSATPLNVGTYLQIQYLGADAGFIQVEDTDAVTERARIEGGTGKYQQVSSDDQALTLPQALELVQQQLEAYGVIPETFEFETFQSGLYVGQVLTILMDLPAGIDVVDKEWFIQEIRAEAIPVQKLDDDPVDYRGPQYLPGDNGGHYRYKITCIDVTQVGSWIDFWLGMGGGSGSGSGTAFSGGGSLGSQPTGNSYSTSFAALTSVTVLHGLNTRNVMVMVYDTSGNMVIPSNIQVTDANTVVLTFGVAMAGSVVVMGG